MSAGISEVYAEEGQMWLRVSPGHAVSEQWLREQAADLYAEWWAAPGAAQRDRLALQIEHRLEELEGLEGSWRPAVDRMGRAAPRTALADRVAGYEASAERLGAIGLDDPARPAAHLAHQAAGDALRDELAASSSLDTTLLARRLDAADLVADRPFIEAVAGIDVHVDRLAVAALSEAGGSVDRGLSADAIRSEMSREDPHAALRADVLSAVTAAGHDPVQLRAEIEARGVDLQRMAPALVPASDFYARHASAIEARLDREITAAGFDGLPSYVASWRTGRPATASLHDTEQALVEHVVGDVIASVDADGRDVREAHRMWERAAHRAAIREWSAALERGDLELAVDSVDGPERQLELGLHIDDAVVDDRRAEQEVG